MYLIHNATIINEGKSFTGSVLVDGELIQTIYKTTGDVPQDIINRAEIID